MSNQKVWTACEKHFKSGIGKGAGIYEGSWSLTAEKQWDLQSGQDHQKQGREMSLWKRGASPRMESSKSTVRMQGFNPPPNTRTDSASLHTRRLCHTTHQSEAFFATGESRRFVLPLILAVMWPFLASGLLSLVKLHTPCPPKALKLMIWAIYRHRGGACRFGRRAWSPLSHAVLIIMSLECCHLFV